MCLFIQIGTLLVYELLPVCIDSNILQHCLLSFCTICHTVFDLISGLSAYVILGQKIALISDPPPPFFFLAFKYFASIPGAKRYFRRTLPVRERL